MPVFPLQRGASKQCVGAGQFQEASRAPVAGHRRRGECCRCSPDEDCFEVSVGALFWLATFREKEGLQRVIDGAREMLMDGGPCHDATPLRASDFQLPARSNPPILAFQRARPFQGRGGGATSVKKVRCLWS
jgi:hypothetical protein